MISLISQSLYDGTTASLLDLFEAMIADAEADPRKWDEEYAEHAVSGCIDRLFCAGPRRPSESLRERAQELWRRAAPFEREDVPLPGTVEAIAEEIACRLYAERWPERAEAPLGDLRFDDPIRVAIYAEANRDAALEFERRRAARETERSP